MSEIAAAQSAKKIDESRRMDRRARLSMCAKEAKEHLSTFGYVPIEHKLEVMKKLTAEHTHILADIDPEILSILKK